MFGGHPVPAWATVLAEGPSEAVVLARPPLRSGSIAAAFHLSISQGEYGIEVREAVIGARLPKECPELHILPTGAFCLSRRSDGFDSPHNAAVFWRRLGDFLIDLHVAERQRQWPAGRWMSHGNPAANEQEAAEKIALKNSWANDYANAIENDEGWIAEAVRRGIGQPGIANCPCVLASALRGTARGRCRHQPAVKRMVATERRRRSAERQYLNGLYERGLRCCGRIDGCKLEERSA